VNFLIILFQSVALIFRGIGWILFILRAPLKIFFGFFFNKIVVKSYLFYLALMKKIGLREKSADLFLFLRRKIVHFSILLIAAVLSFSSIKYETNAQSLQDNARKTVLSSLIKSEFESMDSVADRELIQETAEGDAFSPGVSNQPENDAALKYVSPSDETEEEEISLFSSEDASLSAKGIALVSQEETVVMGARDQIIYYTVETGDSISTIAKKFGISVNTILWENKLSIYSLIRPGDRLAILPVSGVTYQVKSGETLSLIARRYGVEEEKILAANNLSSSSILKIGQKLIIPGGTSSSYASGQSTARSGIDVISDLVKSSSATPVAGNKMNWPTTSTRITQYFSWRHYGLDIGNKTGEPIYAADAGIVIAVGWNAGGYGNYVMIDHGGGKITVYGHASKLYVKKGQQVDKGETIAAIGSTGRSTGPHLHFEVRINGVKYNPFNYLR